MGSLLALALVCSTAAPDTTAASDGGIVLTTHVLSSVAFDLDGDGSKEIVAIVTDTDERATLRVQAWGVRGGDWVTFGQDVVETWNAIEGASLTAHLSEETAVLLVLGDGDGQRLIAAVGRPYTDGETPGSCCLSFGTVRLAGGGLTFDPASGDLGSGESLTAVDVDADGRSELLLSMSIPNDNGPWETEYTLLRQVGESFAAEPVALPDGEIAYFNISAETDGTSGDDLLFTTDDGESILRATASAGGGLRFERAAMADVIDTRIGGWIVGAADGSLVLVSDRSIVTARWPAGGKIEPAATVVAGSNPSMYVVGSGPDARLVEVDGLDDPSAELGMRVYDLSLNVQLEVDAPATAARLWRTIVNAQNEASPLGNAWPEMGPIPGGLPDGRAAFLGPGQMVSVGSGGQADVRSAAQLVGGQVMGAVGSDSGWLAHGVGWYQLETSAYFGGFGATPEGLAESRVVVVPIESVLDVANSADIDVAFEGATIVDSPDGPRLFTGADGFRATVAGDPGTRVATVAGSQSRGEVIEGDPVSIEIDPGGRHDRNWRQTVSLVVVSSAGIAQMLEWDLTTLRLPPEVTAASSFALFDGHATVAGTVDFGTTVTVDGRAVETAADGSYRIDIDASPWPRDVAVVARDPLGSEVVRHIDVVGFVDVRALPWAPIVIALTILGGVILFVRTPSLRPTERLLPDSDGRLEEVDGDGI